MNFTEIVSKLLIQNGISKNKMLKDLNMGTGTFATWEKRGTIPSAETVSKIADYFGVTTDYLLGKTDIKNRPAAESNEPRDVLIEEIMENVKKLNGEQKESLIRFIDAFIASRDDHASGK